MPGQEQDQKKQLAAREALDIIADISSILNTHLSRKQLAACVSLIQRGVNPEALANLIKELRHNYPDEPTSEA
ncbi:hypothetical protein BT63DRAFT_452361 [Microthyrium microscopicum]|uniref:Mitotic-spindle organizing protein 1 n=1 Tax=Microthyrium microscopicum TaxID=703497 RepID=A0A6A6UK71_9PEZI|nr:hypothetical protein BT63DRAFT_452361 [Microthyrium microscopicum]